ncbi:MAG TPA: methyltransferase [Bacteroidia bacterium]|nr:methyltransferase [Bacteroidia bacterium]
MSDTTFRFRQFTVHQEKCAMKVGTDAVLLGSWVQAFSAQRILDIGTGTGLLALMLAQKSFAEIDAVDIDEGAYLQAKENFRISPWFARLHIFHQSFQDFVLAASGKYDLIVSNPPYFQHASKPFQESRINARHNDSLTFPELIEGVKKILSPSGRFCLILPHKEGMEFMDQAHAHGLFCNHIVRIKTKADKAEKRIMMEFGFRFVVLTEEELIIQEEDNSFTQNYINLTKEYYLNLKSAPSSSP